MNYADRWVIFTPFLGVAPVFAGNIETIPRGIVCDVQYIAVNPIKTNNFTEVRVKRTTFVCVTIALCLLVTGTTFTQTNVATQTVSLAVQAVSRLSVSGDPGALTISGGVAGTDALTPASDNSTNYRMTTNVVNSRISAQMGGAALPTGIALTVNFGGTQGSSAGSVDLSDAAAHNVVTSIARGASNGNVITYGLAASSTADPFSTSRVVTLTLTGP
jgi:hypothetical protein